MIKYFGIKTENRIKTEKRMINGQKIYLISAQTRGALI